MTNCPSHANGRQCQRAPRGKRDGVCAGGGSAPRSVVGAQGQVSAGCEDTDPWLQCPRGFSQWQCHQTLLRSLCTTDALPRCKCLRYFARCAGSIPNTLSVFYREIKHHKETLNSSRWFLRRKCQLSGSHPNSADCSQHQSVSETEKVVKVELAPIGFPEAPAAGPQGTAPTGSVREQGGPELSQTWAPPCHSSSKETEAPAGE